MIPTPQKSVRFVDESGRLAAGWSQWIDRISSIAGQSIVVGGSHNDLGGRSDSDCHPASAISYGNQSAQTALDGISSSISVIETNVSNIETTANSANSKSSSALSQVSDLSSAVSSLSSSVSENTAQISGLSVQVSNINEALDGKLAVDGTAVDSEKLGGQLPAYYATASALSSGLSTKLDATAQAADSAKLGGQLPAYYATASALAAKLSDAPSDGSTYGRKDGAWVTVSVGIADAPNDGKAYVRKSLGWVEGVDLSASNQTKSGGFESDGYLAVNANVAQIGFRNSAKVNRFIIESNDGGGTFLIYARNDDGSARDIPMEIQRDSAGALLIRRKFGNSTWTASTLGVIDSTKTLVSLANAAGFVKNDGYGGITYTIPNYIALSGITRVEATSSGAKVTGNNDVTGNATIAGNVVLAGTAISGLTPGAGDFVGARYFAQGDSNGEIVTYLGYNKNTGASASVRAVSAALDYGSGLTTSGTVRLSKNSSGSKWVFSLRNGSAAHADRWQMTDSDISPVAIDGGSVGGSYRLSALYATTIYEGSGGNSLSTIYGAKASTNDWSAVQTFSATPVVSSTTASTTAGAWYRVANRNIVDYELMPKMRQTVVFQGAGTGTTATASEQVVSTTANWGTKTLAANVLQQGMRIKTAVMISVSSYTSATTLTLRLRMGGLAGVLLCTASVPISSAIGEYQIEFSAVATAAPSASSPMAGWCVAPSAFTVTSAGAANVATNASKTVDITCQLSSATAGVSVQQLSVEVL